MDQTSNPQQFEIHECDFEMHLFQAQVQIRFPCRLFISWKDFRNKRSWTIEGSEGYQSELARTKRIDIVIKNGVAVFDQTLKANKVYVLYDIKNQCYVLHPTWINVVLISNRKPDEEKLVGRISVDLQRYLQGSRTSENPRTDLLEFCSVKNAALKYEVKLVNLAKTSLKPIFCKKQQSCEWKSVDYSQDRHKKSVIESDNSKIFRKANLGAERGEQSKSVTQNQKEQQIKQNPNEDNENILQELETKRENQGKIQALILQIQAKKQQNRNLEEKLKEAESTILHLEKIIRQKLALSEGQRKEVSKINSQLNVELKQNNKLLMAQAIHMQEISENYKRRIEELEHQLAKLKTDLMINHKLREESEEKSKKYQEKIKHYEIQFQKLSPINLMSEAEKSHVEGKQNIKHAQVEYEGYEGYELKIKTLTQQLNEAIEQIRRLKENAKEADKESMMKDNNHKIRHIERQLVSSTSNLRSACDFETESEVRKKIEVIKQEIGKNQMIQYEKMLDSIMELQIERDQIASELEAKKVELQIERGEIKSKKAEIQSLKSELILMKSEGASASFSGNQEESGKIEISKAELQEKQNQIVKLKKQLTALRGIKEEEDEERIENPHRKDEGRENEDEDEKGGNIQENLEIKPKENTQQRKSDEQVQETIEEKYQQNSKINKQAALEENNILGMKALEDAQIEHQITEQQQKEAVEVTQIELKQQQAEIKQIDGIRRSEEILSTEKIQQVQPNLDLDLNQEENNQQLQRQQQVPQQKYEDLAIQENYEQIVKQKEATEKVQDAAIQNPLQNFEAGEKECNQFQQKNEIQEITSEKKQANEVEEGKTEQIQAVIPQIQDEAGEGDKQEQKQAMEEDNNQQNQEKDLRESEVNKQQRQQGEQGGYMDEDMSEEEVPEHEEHGEVQINIYQVSDKMDSSVQDKVEKVQERPQKQIENENDASNKRQEPEIFSEEIDHEQIIEEQQRENKYQQLQEQRGQTREKEQIETQKQKKGSEKEQKMDENLGNLGNYTEQEPQRQAEHQYQEAANQSQQQQQQQQTNLAQQQKYTISKQQYQQLINDKHEKQQYFNKLTEKSQECEAIRKQLQEKVTELIQIQTFRNGQGNQNTNEKLSEKQQLQIETARKMLMEYEEQNAVLKKQLEEIKKKISGDTNNQHSLHLNIQEDDNIMQESPENPNYYHENSQGQKKQTETNNGEEALKKQLIHKQDLQNEIHIQKKVIEELENTVKQKEEEIKYFSKILEEREIQNEQQKPIQEDISVHKIQINRLKQQLQTLQTVQQNLRAQLQQKQEEITGLKTSMEEIQIKYQVNIKEIKAYADQLANELQYKANQLNALKDELFGMIDERGKTEGAKFQKKAKEKSELLREKPKYRSSSFKINPSEIESLQQQLMEYRARFSTLGEPSQSNQKTSLLQQKNELIESLKEYILKLQEEILENLPIQRHQVIKAHPHFIAIDRQLSLPAYEEDFEFSVGSSHKKSDEPAKHEQLQQIKQEIPEKPQIQQLQIAQQAQLEAQEEVVKQIVILQEQEQKQEERQNQRREQKSEKPQLNQETSEKQIKQVGVQHQKQINPQFAQQTSVHTSDNLHKLQQQLKQSILETQNLKQKILELENNLECYEKTVEEREEELKNLNEDKLEYIDRLERLADELQESEKIKLEYESELLQIKYELSELKTELMNRDREREAAESLRTMNLSELVHQTPPNTLITQLNSFNQQISIEPAQLIARLAEFQTLNNSLAEQIKSLEVDTITLEERCEKAEQDRARMQEQKNREEQNKKVLQQKIIKLQEEAQNNESTFQKLREEKEGLLKSKLQLEEQIKEKVSLISKLELDSEELQRKIHSEVKVLYENRISGLESIISQLERKSIENNQQSIQLSELTPSKLAEQLQERNKLIESLNQQIEEEIKKNQEGQEKYLQLLEKYYKITENTAIMEEEAKKIYSAYSSLDRQVGKFNKEKQDIHKKQNISQKDQRVDHESNLNEKIRQKDEQIQKLRIELNKVLQEMSSCETKKVQEGQQQKLQTKKKEKDDHLRENIPEQPAEIADLQNKSPQIIENYYLMLKNLLDQRPTITQKLKEVANQNSHKNTQQNTANTTLVKQSLINLRSFGIQMQGSKETKQNLMKLIRDLEKKIQLAHENAQAELI